MFSNNNKPPQKKSHSVTIADVAKAANVSKTTVSMVLNRRSDLFKISKATQKKVTDIARELNYSPNRLARSFSMNRSFTLGIVTAKPQEIFAGTYSARVMKGIFEVANERDYNIMIFDDAVTSSSSYASLIANRSVDGVLILSNDYPDLTLDSKINELRENRMAYVFVWRKSVASDGDIVSVDNRYGIQLSIEHLLSLGHTRIATIARGKESFSSAERINSVAETLTANGIPFTPDLVWHNELHPDEDEKIVTEILNLQQPPTAINVLYDPIAINVINILANRGISIPEEMSVIGFGDILMSTYSRPPLTTIKEPLEQIGREAAAILVDKIEHSDRFADDREIVLEPELIIRGSCGKTNKDFRLQS